MIRCLLALLLLAPATAAARDRFVPAIAVVRVNDVYRVDAVENGAAGGLGRVATLVERTRRAGSAPVMVFHAGDFIAPSLESKHVPGAQMIDALNFLAARSPMLVIPGNHEFDATDPAMLRDAVRGSHFPWLAGMLPATATRRNESRRWDGGSPLKRAAHGLSARSEDVRRAW